MVKTIEIPGNSISYKLRVINGILGLSNQELEVLSTMITHYPQGVGRLEKKDVLEKTSLTSTAAMNNLLSQLKGKGAIRKDGAKWMYTPILSNISIMNSLILKFNAETGDN